MLMVLSRAARMGRAGRLPAGRRAFPLTVSMTVLVTAGVLMATTGLPGCASRTDRDAEFTALASRYLDGMFERDPVWATALGDHRFDGTWPDFTRAGIADELAFHHAYLDSVSALSPDRLNDVNAVDHAILSDAIAARIFALSELREAFWNPLLYNTGDGIYALLARDFAPLPDRLASVRARLEGLPALLAAARENLQEPPRIFTETAITQNRGTIRLILDDLQPHLEQVPHLRDEMVTARSAAIAALEEHGRWLEDELLPRSTGDFRLGPDLWRKKLRYSLASDLDPDALLARAEQDLADTRAQMRAVAEPLYREYFPEEDDPAAFDDQTVIGRVLERIADDHPSDETIVEQAARDLAALADFVRQRELVTVPDKPVSLIVMPEHQRGVWIAYCDSPGPLEQSGHTFYAIAPTPADWSPERKESFYREYNDAMLQVLTVHEAMPGHYLQIAHANDFEAPTPLRAIFSSGTFVEGWATYAEQLMVEAGWGGPGRILPTGR
ncbi:MAG: DUF885 domain-containing protein [Candidatus Krumholzibacteriia bacterium]